MQRLLYDRDLIEAQGLFNHAKIIEMKQAVDSGKNTKEDMSLWALLTFQRFWQRYLA